MFRLRKLSVIAFSLIAAVVLALLSSYVERVGPELAVYGNMCGPSGSDFCYKPVLKGGFPIAYLFDMPGVSVERELAFVEDQLFVGRLMADITFYFALVLIAIRFVSHHRSSRTRIETKDQA